MYDFGFLENMKNSYTAHFSSLFRLWALKKATTGLSSRRLSARKTLCPYSSMGFVCSSLDPHFATICLLVPFSVFISEPVQLQV